MTAPAPVPLAASVAVPPDALLASSLHSARSRSKASLCMSRLASTVGSHPPYEAHPLIHKATMPTAVSLVITRLLLVNYTRGERVNRSIHTGPVRRRGGSCPCRAGPGAPGD